MLATSIGQSCVTFGGYHTETPGAIVYALVPRCDQLDSLTAALSHELLEASTDPHVSTAPAFDHVDAENYIWQVTPGGEVGDMCEYANGGEQRLVENYLVQRTWSNRSAAAGHDPCVPVLSTPYVEAAADVPDISVNVGNSQVVSTRAIQVPVRMSKVIDIDLYSDAVAASWTVQAIDVGAMYFGHPELSLALDQPSGHNGDKLHLTVARTAMGMQLTGDSEIELVTLVNGVTIGTLLATRHVLTRLAGYSSGRTKCMKPERTAGHAACCFLAREGRPRRARVRSGVCELDGQGLRAGGSRRRQGR